MRVKDKAPRLHLFETRGLNILCMLNPLCLQLLQFVTQVHCSHWDQTYNKICIQWIMVSPQTAGKWFFSAWHFLSENPVSPHVKLTTSAIMTVTTRSSQCNGLSAFHSYFFIFPHPISYFLWNKKQLVITSLILTDSIPHCPFEERGVKHSP